MRQLLLDLTPHAIVRRTRPALERLRQVSVLDEAGRAGGPRASETFVVLSSMIRSWPVVIFRSTFSFCSVNQLARGSISRFGVARGERAPICGRPPRAGQFIAEVLATAPMLSATYSKAYLPTLLLQPV